MYEIYCKLRDLKGMTDYAVSKETGVNRSTFSDWKSGRSVPKHDKLQKIADFFGVTIEYLMTGTQANEFILSEEERRLICAYRQATDDRREAVRLLLDFPTMKDVQAAAPYSA